MTRDKFKEQLDELNAQVLAEIENGSVDWIRDWTIKSFFNFETKREYSFFNSYWLAKQKAIPGGMLTFNQIKKLGYHLNKGSQGKEICYYDRYLIHSSNPKFEFYEKLEKAGQTESSVDENGDKVFEKWFCKGYYVFQATDVVDANNEPIEKEVESEDINQYELYSKIKERVSKIGIKLAEPKEFNTACYSPSENAIYMPSLGQFNNSFELYFQTFAHELMHALDYNFNIKGNNKFGDSKYAENELIAELGSFHICKLANIVPNLENTGAYLRGWLSRIKKEKFSIQKTFSDVEKIINHYNWLFELGE